MVHLKCDLPVEHTYLFALLSTPAHTHSVMHRTNKRYDSYFDLGCFRNVRTRITAGSQLHPDRPTMEGVWLHSSSYLPWPFPPAPYFRAREGEGGPRDPSRVAPLTPSLPQHFSILHGVSPSPWHSNVISCRMGVGNGRRVQQIPLVRSAN